MPVFEANGNSYHARGTQFAGGAGRNLRDKTAIGEVARSDLYWFEQSWKSTACTDRFAQVSVCENDGFAVGQIRGDHGHGNLEIFEAARFKNFFDKVAQPVIAGETQARNAPAADVSKTNFAASSDDPRERRTACVSRAKNAAHAGASDIRNWYVILFENLQNAEMSESTRKATA